MYKFSFILRLLFQHLKV